MASTIYGGRPGTPCRAGAPCSPSKKPTGWPSSWPRAFLKNPGDLRDEPTRLPAPATPWAADPDGLGPCGPVAAALADGRAAEASPATLRGTGDLGVVIQRARGAITVVNTSDRSLLGEITGLGDLSHASVVFSRDGRYAYVFGRDGGLTQVDLLRERIVHRVMQAGNSIGGAVSADGTLVAAQNYVPGGVKVFDAKPWNCWPTCPPPMATGNARASSAWWTCPSAASLTACSMPMRSASPIALTPPAPRAHPRRHWPPAVRRAGHARRAPLHRGLFGEDGLAMVDLWEPQPKVRRILAGYGRGQQPLPVYKMPHLRGWAVAGRHAYLPAIGRHEVLVVDTTTWQEVGRIPWRASPCS